MDLSTFLGLIIAAAGLLGGLILEGGNIFQILKPTAAMIVLGGTIGAVMVSFPLSTFLAALKGFIQVFFPKAPKPGPLIEQMIEFAKKARKDGIISLEGDAKNIKEPFLQKALMMAIDGADPKELRETLELQLHYMDEHESVIPKVWEGAGGFAPTIGIIGAVMGLIQVMQHLDNIEEVGHGIATAFVATIYGVGFSNILFLPSAGKLALLHKKEMVLREMIVDGIILIIEGVNPKVMKDKLMGFIAEKIEDKGEEKK